MTNKERFINEILDNVSCGKLELSEGAAAYFEELVKGRASMGAGNMTENGRKIIKYMQDNYTKMNNLFRSKIIGEGLFMSSRSVSGGIRKLVTDGYVNKLGGSPVTYELTNLGKEYKID